MKKMSKQREIDRRRLLGAAVGTATFGVAGGTPRGQDGWWQSVLGLEEVINRSVQQAITPANARGREYTKEDISQHFKSNGTHNPANPEYQTLARNDFINWRLEIAGLVDHPVSLSLAELRAMPSVTQITRHDCVEGWSCIGEWTGVPLSAVLAPLGVQKRARYVVFFCYDKVANAGGVSGTTENYYESIDLGEAAHPQTILAYGMNGGRLPVPYGAPLRLRLGRQLGYKMPKYLRRIELVESFGGIEGGHGGFYEDNGYAWYAGI